MTQAKKTTSTKSKSTASKSPASKSKVTPKAAPKATSSKTTSDNVVKISSETVKEIVTTGAKDVQKAREQVFALTREGSEKFVKSADTAGKAVYESISVCRDNMETAVECGNLTAAFAKEMSNELVESSNQALSDNLELTKEFFACRTISDMLELQTRMFQNSMDSFFTQTASMSNMMFEYANEAAEPINERFSEVTDKMTKVLSAK